MRFVDTNVILRYLVRPSTPADQARHHACINLFQRIKAGQEHVTTTEAVIAEVLYVLTSRRQYHLSHPDAAARVRPIIALRGLKLAHKRVYLRALDLFSAHTSLDFEDAIIIAHMERLKLRDLYSYDSDFDPIRGISRQQP